MNDQQLKAYKRYILARNKVGLVRTAESWPNGWVPTTSVIRTIDVAGQNHPLFEMNDDWIEYEEASRLWWALEPEYRKTERMSAIRGDYGKSDSWAEATPVVQDVYSILKGV
jgi:hypothetical protein